MRLLSRSPICLIVALSLVALFIAAGSPFAARTADAAAPAPTQAKVMGPAACSAQECHGSTLPKGEGRTVHNEYTLWIKNDKHYKSYQTLGAAKSWTIAKKMGLEGDPRKADRCLTCHTLHKAKEEQGEKYDVADGVTCDACHGPAEKYLEGHSKSRPEHKGWTRAQSLAAGMTDTLDLAVRANICVKCHLQIDHEMLEAGHPYMTFELDAFSVQMPPHWVREKPFTATKAWAAGQAVALRDSLKQLGVRLEKGAPEKYVVDALLLSLAYYSTVRPVADLVVPGAMKPIDDEINWLRGAAGADKEKVKRASTPEFQDKLWDLAKKLGAHDYTADTNKKLLLAYAGSTNEVENIGFKAAEQIFFAIDSLYRPYAVTAKPGNIQQIGEVMDKLEQNVRQVKSWKFEDFNALLGEFQKALK